MFVRMPFEAESNENIFTSRVKDMTHIYKSNYLRRLIFTSCNHFNWGSDENLCNKKDDILALCMTTDADTL